MRITRTATGNKKGILLTLLVIILFILMLAEIVTYVAINSNYDTLATYGSLASAQGLTQSALAAAAQSSLHTSLMAAANVLASQLSAGSQKGNYLINNSQYFLASLIYNGTVYGRSLNTNGATMNNLVKGFANTVVSQLAHTDQGITLNITNASVTVYQGTPFTINATYTALFTASSSAGVFSYPVSVSTAVSLNGTPDLASEISGAPVTINSRSSYPSAYSITGPATASSGSTSPFMFSYGTLAATSACSSVPNSLRNPSYILVAQNSILSSPTCASIINSMGGLVTFGALPGYLVANIFVPYLVYQSPQTFNTLTALNGTKALLSGASLQLLSVSQLQDAIQNGYYYGSPYTQSYLGEVQPVVQPIQPSGAGLFTFSRLSQPAPYFNGATSNIILPNSITINTPYTVSLWFSSNSPSTTSFSGNILSSDLLNSNGIAISLVGGSNPGLQAQIGQAPGNAIFGSFRFAANTWYYLMLSVSNSISSLYVDGGPALNSIAITGNRILVGPQNYLSIGQGAGSSGFNGQLSNIELYNSVLPRYQIQAQYLNGISSLPANYLSLAGWLPLTASTYYITGNALLGISANNIQYRSISGYFGDPIYNELIPQYGTGAAVAEGVLNCPNVNQCSNSPTQQQLYLTNLPLSVASNGIVLNESASLGLSGSVFPEVAQFTTPNSLIVASNGIALLNTSYSFTLSLWAYPTSTGSILWVGNSIIPFASSSNYISINAGTTSIQVHSCGTYSNSAPVPQSSWTNFALTFNGNSGALALYENGNSIGSSSVLTGCFSFTPNLVLGGPDSGVGFTGDISDLRIYNSILSPIQVWQLYENDSVSNSIPANFVWGLSTPYNGMLNTTAQSQQAVQSSHNDWGYFVTSGGATCTQANVVNGACGVHYALP